MASYVIKTLSESEKVIIHAHYHWTKFLWPTFLMLGSLGVLLYRFFSIDSSLIFYFDIAPWIILLYALYKLLVLMSDEVTLTDQRLVAKTGLFNKNTLDLQLSEVESVSANLPFIIHSIFGIGTIIIKGTGGSRKVVSGIEKVLEFRKIVQKTLNEKRAHAGVDKLENKEQHNNSIYESSNKIDILLKLKHLLDNGVITMDEFQTERNNILNSK